MDAVDVNDRIVPLIRLLISAPPGFFVLAGCSEPRIVLVESHEEVNNIVNYTKTSPTRGCRDAVIASIGALGWGSVSVVGVVAEVPSVTLNPGSNPVPDSFNSSYLFLLCDNKTFDDDNHGDKVLRRYSLHFGFEFEASQRFQPRKVAY
jgi:hypothetical protein